MTALRHTTPARQALRLASPQAGSAADKPPTPTLRQGSSSRGGDLRCRREASALIVELAQHLPPEERGLLEAVYLKGLSVQDLARMLGQTTPAQTRALRRRIRSLVQRISQPRFGFVARSCHAWPAPRRRVAQACYLQGLSMRRASRELGLSLYAVRAHCTLIDALFAAASETARRFRTASDQGNAR